LGLNERTGNIVHQLPLAGSPYDLTYGDGALFLHNFKSGRLLRVSRHYTIHRLRSTRPGSTVLTITAGAIWTATRSGMLQRIPLR